MAQNVSDPAKIRELQERLRKVEASMSEAHTIQAAMARGELSEEEAYFVIRFAGHVGYDKAIKRILGPVHEFRRWLIWIGGWEPPHLMQWDDGREAFEPFRWSTTYQKWNLESPLPLSFFGHRISFNGSGRNRLWMSILWTYRGRRGWLMVSPFKDGDPNLRIFWTPDGTPCHSDAVYFVGQKPLRYDGLSTRVDIQ